MSQKLKLHKKPILKIINLKFRYPEQLRYILNGINLKLYPQEVRIIVGPSGCGKSTLVNSICGFIPHSIEGEISGSISVNGNLNENRTIYQIAKDTSLVQQDPEAQLCTTDVYHEIAFALENFLMPEERIKDRVRWVLKKLNLTHLKHRKLHTLSGGEKQKVAIASMLVLKPKVLVFDEPTANLDPKAANDFIKLIDNLRWETKIGILIVDHNPAQYYKIADHLLILDNGAIQHIYSSHQYKDFNQEYYKNVFNRIQLSLNSGAIKDKGKLSENIQHLDNNPLNKKFNNIKLKKIKRITKTSMYKNTKKQLIGQDNIITLTNLGFNYGTHKILKKISLSINRGEFIGIMGDNGSGKTTLIQNILNLLPPTDGGILYKFNRSKTNKTSTSELAKDIGYVFQNPNHMLFGNTVWDEVMLGPRNFGQDPSLASEKAVDLLKLGELTLYRSTHPILLSHGEKRRLNIASILCYDPEIIMLDEPFIGQDPENISKILDYLIQMVSRRKTVIMVTHRSDIVARYCSRLLFLKDGELIFDDLPENVFKHLKELGENSYLPIDYQILGGLK